MSSNPTIYDFVFRGLLAETALDVTRRQLRYKDSISIEKRVADKLPLQEMDEALLARSRRMAVVYLGVTVFENTVREFIRNLLLEQKGANWWDTCVSTTVKQKVQSRISDESKIPWHAPRGADPLNYTDFGNLSTVICNNWNLFEPYLHDQDWVKHIFNTIEVSRNICMHSGDLSDRDIERIGSLIRDWFDQVGG